MKIVMSISVLVAMALCVGGALEAQTGAKPGNKPGNKAGNKAGRKKTTKKTTKKRSSTKAIDVKVQRFQESFVREAAGLANQYEDAGDLVKTRQMLELILKLSPEVKGVRAKIKQIDEEMLSANELTVDVDVAGGWGRPVAVVFKGRPFRIQAAGDYRFVTNLPIGPAGFSVGDTAVDMAAGIRCGALIGVVVPAPGTGKKPRPGKPFLVGTGGMISPRESGLLFLKINAPAGHKNNGRLKVKMTGSVRKP